MQGRQTAGREHRSTEGERERKDRVLPFYHLQSDSQIIENAHERIVRGREVRCQVAGGRWQARNGLLFRENHSTKKGHKPATFQPVSHWLTMLFAYPLQFLSFEPADVDHASTTFPQLLKQRRRNFRRGSGNNNGI